MKTSAIISEKNGKNPSPTTSSASSLRSEVRFSTISEISEVGDPNNRGVLRGSVDHTNGEYYKYSQFSEPTAHIKKFAKLVKAQRKTMKNLKKVIINFS